MRIFTHIRGLGRTASGLVFVAIVASCASRTSTTDDAPSAAIQSYVDALQLLDDGNSVLARRRLDAIVAADPLFVGPHRELQKLRIANFEREAVVAEARALRRRHPRSSAAWYLAGRVLHRDDAKRDAFTRALALEPVSPWAFYGMAVLASREQGGRDRALAWLDRSFGAETRVPAELLRAQLLNRNADRASAEAAARRALAVRPKYAPTHATLAAIAQRQGRTSRELTRLDDLLSLPQPDFSSAAARLARLAKRHETAVAPLALDVLDRARARRPDDADVLLATFDVYVARGDDAEAIRVSEHPGFDAAVTVATVFSVRRLLVRLGRPAEAFRRWALSIDVDPSIMTEPLGRLATIARHHQRLKRPTTSDRLQLLDALDRAGWHREAADLARRLRVTEHVDHVVVRRVLAHERVLSRVRLAGFESPRPKTLVELLDRVAAAIEKEVGRLSVSRSNSNSRANTTSDGDVDADSGSDSSSNSSSNHDIVTFPLIGEMLRVGVVPRGVNAYFAAHGQMLFAGQLDGGNPELLLLSKVWQRDAKFEDESVIEFAGSDVVVRPTTTFQGDVAGQAFDRFFYLDLDVIAASCRSLERRTVAARHRARELLDSRGLAAAGFAERVALDQPLDVEVTLLQAAVRHHDKRAFRRTVRAHELGHVLDARRHLPVWSHLFANLVLAFEGGLSRTGVQALLEESAALHSLRTGPSPYLVLADLVRAIEPTDSDEPHARGYLNLLRRFVRRLDADIDAFPSIDPGRVLLHQLHQLSEEEVRMIARAL